FRIKKRYRAGLRVVATGGGAKIIGPYCKNIDRINPVLTLQGLKIIYETGLKIDKNKRNIKKRRDNKRK
ncbi:MAG: hypothetical protein U9R31_02905, partial [Candidatus Omnitrophota bacterium]|nr:hypothetical protein [Candidatus Omnitrophota bacterium]